MQEQEKYILNYFYHQPTIGIIDRFFVESYCKEFNVKPDALFYRLKKMMKTHNVARRKVNISKGKPGPSWCWEYYMKN